MCVYMTKQHHARVHAQRTLRRRRTLANGGNDAKAPGTQCQRTVVPARPCRRKPHGQPVGWRTVWSRLSRDALPTAATSPARSVRRATWVRATSMWRLWPSPVERGETREPAALARRRRPPVAAPHLSPQIPKRRACQRCHPAFAAGKEARVSDGEPKGLACRCKAAAVLPCPAHSPARPPAHIPARHCRSRKPTLSSARLMRRREHSQPPCSPYHWKSALV